jgi:hypothetical protein
MKHLEVADLVEAIRSILAGYPAPIQGAVLADCLAIWLAGHHVPGEKEATRKLRADLLAMHCSTVRQLVPGNAGTIGTTP